MASYYDLHDILAEEEHVSTTFLKRANGVGVIDPASSSEDNDVEQGADVDLPFWLAQALANWGGVHIKMPSFYKDRLRNEIQADAACVNLKLYCPYFYEFGSKLLALTRDRSLGSFLLYTIQGRYRDMLCRAHSASSTESPRFLSYLTKEELFLFEAGRNSMRAFKKWRFQGVRLQRAAVLGRKRRNNALLSPFDLT